MFHKELIEVLKDISISLRKLSNRSNFPIEPKSSKDKIEMRIESSNFNESSIQEDINKEKENRLNRILEENRNGIGDQFFIEDAVPLELLEDN